MTSLHITTNSVDIEKYLHQFEQIYVRYSSAWIRGHVPHKIDPKFDFGSVHYFDSKTKTEIVSKEEFLIDVAEIVKNTPIIPYTISHAVAIEDVVAGTVVYLVPDETATIALTQLDKALRQSRFGEKIYLETGEFIPSAGLQWVKLENEATSIVDAIDELSIEIKGQINQIVIYEFVDKQEVILKTFKLSG